MFDEDADDITFAIKYIFPMISSKIYLKLLEKYALTGMEIFWYDICNMLLFFILDAVSIIINFMQSVWCLDFLLVVPQALIRLVA